MGRSPRKERKLQQRTQSITLRPLLSLHPLRFISPMKKTFEFLNYAYKLSKNSHPEFTQV